MRRSLRSKMELITAEVNVLVNAGNLIPVKVEHLNYSAQTMSRLISEKIALD